MKTLKFIAMLMAAFALSFSFASCGDDDDDTPAPTAKVNEIRILNESATITNGMIGYFGTGHIELMFRAEGENVDPNKYTSLMFDIHELEPDQNGHIPTGTYPHGRYELFNGELNTTGNSGYYFTSTEASGPMKVERSGNTYTITIEKLAIHYTDLATQKEGNLTTSFKYKGALQNHGE